MAVVMTVGDLLLVVVALWSTTVAVVYRAPERTTSMVDVIRRPVALLVAVAAWLTIWVQS